MRNSTSSARVSFLFTVFLAATALSVGASGPVTEMSSAGDRVAWTVSGSYQSATLTIAVPDGSVIERTFAATEGISFSPLDIEGMSMVDGIYTWQIVLSPDLDQKTREVLESARNTVDRPTVDALRERGQLPAEEELVHSGSFRIANSSLVNDSSPESEPETAPLKGSNSPIDLDGQPETQVISQDLVVQGSECVGIDCASSESFGFDTIRLKENNLRIHFMDTSSSASFPTNDWRIIANDSSNGGGNYLAIEDSNAGTQVFRVDAGAGANALRVDAQGDVGIGTATAVVELHIADGDSPTLRLEQNGSSGFTPQTWDVAGNEANFFVRDVTNGSKLPFKIKPGAPTSSIFVAADGDIGMGTESPDSRLDIESATDANFGLRLSRSAVQWVVQLNKSTDATAPNGLAFTKVGSGSREMQVKENGDLHILGNYFANGTQLTVPDYVFEPSYDLMPLDSLAEFVSAERHLPNIPPAGEIQKSGLNMTDMQLRLLEKIEELTLYTIQQQATIAELEARMAALEVEPAE